MLCVFPAAQRDRKLPQDGPWKFFCLAMTLMLLLLVLIFGVFLAEGNVLSHWEWVITWTQAPKPAVLRRGLYRAGAEMGQ